MADLAKSIPVEGKPTLEELLSTLINRDEVEKLIRQPVKTRPFYSMEIDLLSNRVVGFSVLMEKNVLLSSFNPTGELIAFVVLINSRKNGEGRHILSPQHGYGIRNYRASARS